MRPLYRSYGLWRLKGFQESAAESPETRGAAFIDLQPAPEAAGSVDLGKTFLEVAMVLKHPFKCLPCASKDCVGISESLALRNIG